MQGDKRIWGRHHTTFELEVGGAFKVALKLGRPAPHSVTLNIEADQSQSSCLC